VNTQSIEEKLAVDRKDRQPDLERAFEGEEMTGDVVAWSERSSSTLHGSNKEESGHGKGWEVKQDIMHMKPLDEARKKAADMRSFRSIISLIRCLLLLYPGA
jgi:hypothetical protein